MPEPQDAAAYETALQALADEVPVAVGLHPVFDPTGDHVPLPESDSDDDDAGAAVAVQPKRKSKAVRSRGRPKRSGRAAETNAPQNSTSFSRYDVAVLPLNDQGVSFARNHILSEVAPARGWFWVMDDDITKFNRAAYLTLDVAAKIGAAAKGRAGHGRAASRVPLLTRGDRSPPPR